MELIEVSRWLIAQRYIVLAASGKYELTKAFHDQLKTSLKTPKLASPITSIQDLTTTDEKPNPALYSTYNYAHWSNFYSQFIAECRVPARIESGNQVYSGNKYTEEGMKAFQKALKNGFEYKGLVMAVTLYYKSAVGYKKAVGRYMADGEWRTDYNEIMQQAKEGTLEKHIKESVNDKSGSQWNWG